MKVIYTCPKNEFESLHFDINHLPVIIYDGIEDLRTKLHDKIGAYVLG